MSETQTMDEKRRKYDQILGERRDLLREQWTYDWWFVTVSLLLLALSAATDSFGAGVLFGVLAAIVAHYGLLVDRPVVGYYNRITDAAAWLEEDLDLPSELRLVGHRIEGQKPAQGWAHNRFMDLLRTFRVVAPIVAFANLLALAVSITTWATA